MSGANEYSKIVVLTGAGVSQESGLKTFRDNDGLWENHRIEDVATPEAFAKDPHLVHRFYNLRRAQLNETTPNPAHIALAEFEASFQGSFAIVTQNVDDLHERAGSKNVIHIHGQLRQARCLDTGEVFDWNGDLSNETVHPNPGRPNGRLRPHICWFGEVPFFMDEIMKLVAEADLFIAIGTSGAVYPAAGLVSMTPANCHTVLLNQEASDNAPAFAEKIYGPASQVVTDFFKT